MARAPFARRIALLFLVALHPAIAIGLQQTYEGTLVPDNRDPPIPIVVELHVAGSLLAGSVKTSLPLAASAPIESGGNAAGNCTVDVALSRTQRLYLRGRCEQKTFVGTYTLFDTQRRTTVSGSFSLADSGPDAAKPDGTRATTATGGTMAGCLNANTRCLTACPHGDDSAQMMCSSRCRSKLRACKGQIRKAPAELE
jgi:hypothetical protein